MKLVIKYRQHRGGFDESMNELETFNNIAELEKAKDNGDGISIEYYGPDHRIKSDTFIVEDNRSGAIGFLWYEAVP